MRPLGELPELPDRRTPRLEVVVETLRAGRLEAYRANVLALADRLDVQAAPHLRNLLAEQEARLRDAGPTVRDYELGRAVLEALDAHDRELEVDLGFDDDNRLRAELDDARQLVAAIILDAGGELLVSEAAAIRAPFRPGLEVTDRPDLGGRTLRLIP